ncbi:hypothetical protein B0H67DRAFT_677495 [Lasiosphaeris hirsuta]|uniref:Uncharacterized protein n=1 Tax=Lasiosphaeris hirsuta TaxID=260670 RepID=A0AA40B865_9PEZI|nr:hypothetical protein B0H67DRAFT_677495 [Lasiosphaeris hirsuta]
MATGPDWDGMLAEFLARDSTTPMQLDALRRLLTMVAEHQPTNHLLPIDEAEEKLRYLGELQKFWKARFPEFSDEPKRLHKPLQPLIIATVMMMDLAMLREIFGPTGVAREMLLDKLLQRLSVVPCFIKTVMTEKRNKDDQFFYEVAGPAMAEAEARLRAIERRQDPSSESYED